MLYQQKIKLTNEELAALRKGDWRKPILAHVVRKETSVSLKWLAQRLKMSRPGYLSRVASNIDDLASRTEWKRVQKHLTEKARKRTTPPNTADPKHCKTLAARSQTGQIPL